MGNLLGAPVTDKETHTGSFIDSCTKQNLEWGVSTMQGWRIHMEDDHITEAKLYAKSDNRKIPLEGHALFAVFDGHGGTFAAEYAGRNFLRILSKQPKFMEYAQSIQEKSKNVTPEAGSAVGISKPYTLLEQALQQAFVETDYEIALAIHGNPHPHANQPYHNHNNESEQDEATATATATSVEEGEDATMTDAVRDVASRAAADHVSALDDNGDSGTTACMVMITPDSLICANAGDSRAIFCRKMQDGDSSIPPRQVIALSYDHKPDDEPEERRIRAAGGYVAAGRVEGDLAVSRGFGDFRFKEMAIVLNNSQLFAESNGEGISPETDAAMASNATTEDATTTSTAADALPAPGDQKVSPIPEISIHTRNHESDEFIVVACDGIWDVLTNPDCVTEVAAMIREGETNMGLLCEELLDTCLRLGSKDNMTAIVVQLPGLYLSNGGSGVLGRRKQREDILKEQHYADEDGSQKQADTEKDDGVSSDDDEQGATMQRGGDTS